MCDFTASSLKNVWVRLMVHLKMRNVYFKWRDTTAFLHHFLERNSAGQTSFVFIFSPLSFTYIIIIISSMADSFNYFIFTIGPHRNEFQ